MVSYGRIEASDTYVEYVAPDLFSTFPLDVDLTAVEDVPPETVTTTAAVVSQTPQIVVPAQIVVPTPLVTRRALPAKPLAIPAWVRFGKQRDGPMREHEDNKRLVAAANAANQQLDFVMYGDSITAFHKATPSVWNKYFGKLAALPLAMGGSTTAELAWRIMRGGEKLKRDPKAIAILVGINDLKWSREKAPAPNLDFIVQWMRQTWPSSQIFVMGLLPNAFEREKNFSIAQTNKKYKALAKKHGATYVDCTGVISIKDKKLIPDGTHPSAEGQDKVLKCLKQAVGL